MTFICCCVQTTKRCPPVAAGLSASEPILMTADSDRGCRLRSTINVATTGAPCFRQISFATQHTWTATTVVQDVFNDSSMMQVYILQ